MVSVKVAVMAIVLLTICLQTTNASAAYRGCCQRYMTTKLPFHVIQGYSVQTARENCNMNAIIFFTKKGKATCTNPALPWVMDYIDRLRNKARRVHVETSKAQK